VLRHDRAHLRGAREGSRRVGPRRRSRARGRNERRRPRALRRLSDRPRSQLEKQL